MNKTALALVGGVMTLYLINLGVVALYKAATAEQVDVLRDRVASLTKLDQDSPRIAQLNQLIAEATFSSFTTPMPYAITARNAVTNHLRREPHLSLGIAVDEGGLAKQPILDLLKRVNALLLEHKFSIGLAADVKRVAFPGQATRSDMLYGTTTVFKSEVDYHIAFTHKRCRYLQARTGATTMPSANRLYSFGRKAVTVVDGVTINDNLVANIATDLARHATEYSIEKRWRSEDYLERLATTFGKARPRGRSEHGARQLALPRDKQRTVSLTVALDGIAPGDARNIIEQANKPFAQYGITFRIQHLYQRRLRDGWKWPLEIKHMQQQNDSDIYLLLTPTEWLSERSGYIRGLGNYLFGAIMVQTGTELQTVKRLAHELGHLFGLHHTLLKGHVMYPNERHIGLKWSAGNKRVLRENAFDTTWQTASKNPARLKLAIELAPPMSQSQEHHRPLRASANYAGTDSWVVCQ